MPIMKPTNPRFYFSSLPSTYNIDSDQYRFMNGALTVHFSGQWRLDRTEQQSKLSSPYLAMLWAVSPSSPKYVAPCGHWLFWSKKCHRAALISPSKRQKRHRGRDRTKIRQSWEVAGWNFLNSQTALAGQNFLFLISYFWKFVFVFPIGSLGKSFGSSKTFNSFVSARANINVYPSLERVLYLFVYDRLTWLSRLKPAVQGWTTDHES